MAGGKLACVILLCMLVAPMTTQAAISCGQVASSLAPCITYLKGSVATPSVQCCSGVNNINNAARSAADRKNTCLCLKNAAGNVAGIDPKSAEVLPSKCGVRSPYKISLSTNCNTIK